MGRRRRQRRRPERRNIEGRAMNALNELSDCGQSVWIDFLKRSFVEGGELRMRMERDGLKGATSNPSIFEKAIGESNEYDAALKKFLSQADHSVSEVYEALAFEDIRNAADALRPVYDRTQGKDGFISLECSPYLANDTEATIKEAQHLWRAVARPNLMVKVPATKAGLPAIRALIAQGINVNITLLFSVDVYERVADAYMSGLEDLAEAGGDVSKVASVASFFVSRIDTAVDKLLEAAKDAGAARLKGKAAIANAKRAYVLFKSLVAGPRWRRLADAGAKVQRLLWASTSTKNPAYKDTMYVEELVGRDTVNTMPPATLDAFRDHGVVTHDAIERDLPQAKADLAALADYGVSLDDVTTQLTEDGVRLFADAFDKLLGAVAQRRLGLLDGPQPGFAFGMNSCEAQKRYEEELETWRENGRIRRLWAGDASLWTGSEEDRWLGWLRIVDAELADAAELEDFAAHVKRQGYSDVLLVGMGGSSLAPEVFAETFGPQPAWPKLHVLDSTDPAQIAATEAALDLSKTLVIVSSKSGGTLEPNILMDYFFERVAALRGREHAGEQFVAVTDKGSSLEKRAQEAGFARVFFGDKTIGGRYSALSRFGLVPAAAMGLDVRRLLENAKIMMRSCGPDAPPAQNSGVRLGVAMGVAARWLQRDKITIIASPAFAPIGAWLEQLFAESTGKHGKGLIPIDDEPLAAVDRYGRDRFFIYIELEGREDARQRQLVEALARAGHPVARVVVRDVWNLGQEFFRFEMATAVAGAVLGVNAFDQPDVEASKVKTRALTAEYEKSHRLPDQEPLFSENGLALYSDEKYGAKLGRHNTLTGYLRSHLAEADARRGDYFALLAYVERNEAHRRALDELRALIHERTLSASCLGFGPRFQHSTGQAYKGGPNSGVFLQITCHDAKDIAVPGHAYSFGVVKEAQARGDFDAMVESGRRALRVHLKDAESGLAGLRDAMEAALR
jgi:transaldolase / glucose-6-phosphate isomerase